MVGLLDIAPSVETVNVNGNALTVHGVSAAGLAYLLRRFPELRALMSGQELGVEKLMAVGGEAVSAIIACGCGYPDNEPAEAVAGALALDVQADLLAATLRLTMPQGVGPFVEKLSALGAVLAPAQPTKAPLEDGAMRIRAKKSPRPSVDSPGMAVQ